MLNFSPHSHRWMGRAETEEEEKEEAWEGILGTPLSTYEHVLSCTLLYKHKVLLARICGYCFMKFPKAHLIQRSCRISCMVVIESSFLDQSYLFNPSSTNQAAICYCFGRWLETLPEIEASFPTYVRNYSFPEMSTFWIAGR